MSRQYTDKEFAEAIKSSKYMGEALEKIGLKPAGGNYHLARLRVNKLGLDTSHFIYKPKGMGKRRRVPTEEILVKNSSWSSSSRLRERLIKEGYFDEVCSICKMTEWLGKKMPLELDHINGEKTDNRIENLRLICPNCHSFTPTYRGRNRGKKQKKLCGCGREIDKRSFLCKKCSNEKLSFSRRKVVRPSVEKLLKEVENNGYSATGRKYGVSDNAIRKWLKNNV
jgi:hypothetical protein